MRNILLIPDGSEQDFMYPPNREVLVGEILQIVMSDDSVRMLKIIKIEKQEKRILYHLSY